MTNHKNITLHNKLNIKDVKSIAELLDVDIDFDAVKNRIEKYPEDDLIFPELAMKDYSPQLENRSVSEDHKWDPEYVILQINQVLSGNNLALKKPSVFKYIDDEPGRWVKIEIDGTEHKIETSHNNIQALFDYINTKLQLYNLKFIDVGDNDPPLMYLLVEKSFDPKLLTNIILYQQAAPSFSPMSKPINIHLKLEQSWLDHSSDTALEEFKTFLAEKLNNSPVERNSTDRWYITEISENNKAYLVYYERPVATLEIKDGYLEIQNHEGSLPRYDDVMYAVRYCAYQLHLNVYSLLHNEAKLPRDFNLAFEHSYFKHNKSYAKFFEQSKFSPRFSYEALEQDNTGRTVQVVRSPFYAEHKDGSVHILNNSLLEWLIKKDNQSINEEFSYKIAESLDDFSRKHDLGLVPISFYQNYGYSTKIINDTYFDVFHIDRKVFIDPYVWDYNDENNVENYNSRNSSGVHLMDKVRKGEDLDSAIKRILDEELGLPSDYVGARVWGIEFDRDRNSTLTPRLKMNIFVKGLNNKKQAADHDWVSVK